MTILSFVGAALSLVGWIWAVVVAFKTSGAIWGIANLIIVLQPVVGIVSALFKKIGWTPVLLIILGNILLFVGGAAEMFN